MEKKVLIITPYYDPEPFPINSFVEELVKRNNISEVKVITSLPNYRKYGFYNGFSAFGPYNENYEKLKISRLLIVPRFSNSKLAILLFYLSFFISSFIYIFFFSFFNRNKYDHVLTFCGSPVYVGFIGYFASKLLNAKSSQWIQDIWPEAIISTVGLRNKRLKTIISKIQSFMWKLSDILFSESESLSDYLRLHLKNKRVVTLYNPIRTETKFTTSNIKKNNEGLTFSYIGNIGEAQKIELILKSFTSAKLNTCKLNVCGDGSMFKRLSNSYSSSNIIWHGWLDSNKLDQIYSDSDFFVLGLDSKGRQGLIIPSKIQSYFMNKKPVICISAGSISDLVQKNNAGLTCRSFREEDVKQIFKDALNITNSQRKIMANNAYRFYLENFTKSKIVDKFITYI